MPEEEKQYYKVSALSEFIDRAVFEAHRADQEQDQQPQIKITIRLDYRAVDELDQLAEDLHYSRSGLAAALLEKAIADATGYMRYDSAKVNLSNFIQGTFVEGE